MALTDAIDALFSAAVFDMPTPELQLPGQALQLRDAAGRIVVTYIATKDPTLSQTATENNAGVPLGDDSALHLVAHRVTLVDAGKRRRETNPQPLAPGQKGILADLGSTCDSWQPGDGYFPLPGSYLRGHYQEAPVVKNGVAVGPAYYGMILPVVTDNDADHPGLEYWFYTGGPGQPGQRGGHVPRVGIGKGLFAHGQSDPGEGAVRFSRGEFDTVSCNTINARTYNVQHTTQTNAKRMACDVIQIGVWGAPGPSAGYVGWGGMFFRVLPGGQWQLCASDGKNVLAGPMFAKE